EVEIGTPTTSALIVKELGIQKGSGNPKTEKVGNLTMDQVAKIAAMKMPSSYAKSVKTAAMEVGKLMLTTEDTETTEEVLFLLCVHCAILWFFKFRLLIAQYRFRHRMWYLSRPCHRFSLHH
ncbi:MAG: hypothetical protein O8C63_08270, partial [Candidatus Methanoperedens sp.]|nr:hypothetical protein [Candidatus Methanoperedens sp.]